MNPFTRLVLRALLDYKLARQQPTPAAAAPLPPLPSDHVKVAAVQWDGSPVNHVDEWVKRLSEVFARASASRVHLIVFPEYLPLSLLGCIMPTTVGAHTLTDSSVGLLLRSLSPSINKFWIRWMSHFARQYRITTVAGTSLFLERGQLLNMALTFDLEGRECRRQAKWHLLPQEKSWGIASGSGRLTAPLNPLGLSTWVCNDASYFESFRLSEHQGARIVAVPIADPEARYTEGKARRGCFSRVQDVPFIGVVGALTGNLFGIRLTGKAGIYVPIEISPQGTGIIAESPTAVGEGLVIGSVSLKSLEDFRQQHHQQFPVPDAEFMNALYHVEEDH